MIEILGLIAAFLTTASFIPQAYKTLKTKDTSGISFWMYTMFVSGIFCWMVYGFMIASLPLILANSITLLLAGSVLAMKILYSKEPIAVAPISDLIKDKQIQ